MVATSTFGVTRFASGAHLGAYTVERLLGSGAFADVYLARHQILNQEVALKVIRSAETEQWEQEGARLMCRLHHPNIVVVHFADRIDGRLVVAMDYVNGPTLRQLLDEHARLSPVRAARIAVAVADALQFLHTFPTEDGRAFAHLDLKPVNILLERGEVPRLTDFGLAHLTRAVDRAAVAGSPSYMAPEQFAGRPSPRSDIWALGVLLYEMVTGRLPFVADAASESQRAGDSDSPQRQIDFSGVPSQLTEVISRCLRVDPQERFSSARELQNALAASPGEHLATECGRCGATMPVGDACPECTVADPRKIATFQQEEPPAPRAQSGRHRPFLIAALTALSLVAVGGLISYERPVAETKVSQGIEDARAARRWQDVEALAQSNTGSYQDRLIALQQFMASFPSTAQAPQAQELMRTWTAEAQAFDELEKYEQSPNAHMSESIRRWRGFIDAGHTGFGRSQAAIRLREIEQRLAAYKGYAALKVVGATGLATVQSGLFAHKVADPYFVLLRNGQFAYRSLTIIKNPAPVWSEQARLLLEPGIDLAIEIWDRRVFSDDLLVRQSLGPLPPDGSFEVASGTVQLRFEIWRER